MMGNLVFEYEKIMNFKYDIIIRIRPDLYIENEIINFENYIFNDLKIYPNPTNDYLNIEFNNYSSQNISITFENILGQEIIRYNIKEGNQEFSKQFNISEYSKGVYYVKLISNNLKIVEIITKN